MLDARVPSKMTHAKPGLELGGSFAVFALVNLVKVLQLKCSNVADLRMIAMRTHETSIACLLALTICNGSGLVLHNSAVTLWHDSKIRVPASPALEVWDIWLEIYFSFDEFLYLLVRNSMPERDEVLLNNLSGFLIEDYASFDGGVFTPEAQV